MIENAKRLKMKITRSVIVTVAIMAFIGTVFCGSTLAQDSAHKAVENKDAHQISVEHAAIKMEGMKYSLLAAAIAFGLGAVGAGIAIAQVGAAAMGAVAEKPEIAGQALIFVALSEGIVIFGFITALMILGKGSL